jgi:PPOX class probable F420-dependent enzyme
MKRAGERPAPRLTPLEAEVLGTARRGTLATIAADGVPRLVPVCFVLIDTDLGFRLYSPLDEKPKRSADPLGLARVRDIVARPEVSFLADRWDEDWAGLAWVRVLGLARLLERASPEHGAAVAALRDKYAQYATHHLEDRPVVAIDPLRVVSWVASERAFERK